MSPNIPCHYVWLESFRRLDTGWQPRPRCPELGQKKDRERISDLKSIQATSFFCRSENGFSLFRSRNQRVSSAFGLGRCKPCEHILTGGMIYNHLSKLNTIKNPKSFKFHKRKMCSPFFQSHVFSMHIGPKRKIQRLLNVIFLNRNFFRPIDTLSHLDSDTVGMHIAARIKIFTYPCPPLSS